MPRHAYLVPPGSAKLNWDPARACHTFFKIVNIYPDAYRCRIGLLNLVGTAPKFSISSGFGVIAREAAAIVIVHPRGRTRRVDDWTCALLTTSTG
eukprot:SAG31_NODE_1157_length_9612_cov_6.630401_3_plen_95_part_00